MSPKDKANELCKLYMNILDHILVTKKVRQCALITVDEMIKENHEYDDYTLPLTTKLISRHDYLLEVKNEINKL